MQNEIVNNDYDDGNIPEIDLPKVTEIVPPLQESTRPQKTEPVRAENQNV